MPYVNVKVTPSITKEQKESLVEDITNSLERHLGKDPQLTHVVIDEIDMDNWGLSGMLASEYFHGK